MLSIYLDFITLSWATLILLSLPVYISTNRSALGLLSFIAVSLYIFAQSGWTTAYFSGNLWGAEASNLIWFAFNSCVMLLISLVVWRKE